jgi:hypothetical protein
MSATGTRIAKSMAGTASGGTLPSRWSIGEFRTTVSLSSKRRLAAPELVPEQVSGPMTEEIP